MSLQSSASPSQKPNRGSIDHGIDTNVDSTLGKRKRTQQPTACVPCRSRKSKCDGNRLEPCSSCSRRKTHCTYELGVGETRVSKLQRENSLLRDTLLGYQSVIDLIRFSTDEEAVELVKRLRHSSTADEAVSFIRAAASLMNAEQSDKPLPVEYQHSNKPSSSRLITEHEQTRPISRLTQQNLAQQQQHEQLRPVTHRSLLPKQQPHDEVQQTSPVSCSPSSIATHEHASVSPPTYYDLPRLPQPTPYGGLPYTACKDAYAASSAQPLEPALAPRRFPPLFTSFQHGPSVLPPLVGLDPRLDNTPRTGDTSPPARCLKPFHVWPEDTIPEHSSHPPL